MRRKAMVFGCRAWTVLGAVAAQRKDLDSWPPLMHSLNPNTLQDVNIDIESLEYWRSCRVVCFSVTGSFPRVD